MKAFWTPIFLAFVISGSLLSGSDLACATSTNLEEIHEYLPCNITSMSLYDIPRLSIGTGYPAALINVDQDPELEIIRSNIGYVVCEEYSTGGNVNHWQLNFPAEYHSPVAGTAGFGISGALDLGNEKTMVVINGATENRMNWRFWVVDAEAGTVEGQFDLPGGPDRNGDNRWDGSYYILGAMDIPWQKSHRKALIILCNAGFDHDKRGICAVDPWTGERLWDFMPGSVLTNTQCHIQDLDGDGIKEILLASRAPNNLHGRKVNGFSDDRPFLFVLNHSGSLLWSQELESVPGYTALKTGDLDGDGSIELVTVVHKINKNEGALSVWSSEGDLLASLQTDYQVLGCELIPTETNQGLDIITGDRYSKILRLRYEKKELSIQQEATNKRGLCLLGQIDLPGANGAKGLVTQDRDGVGRILDGNFNLVGSYQDTGEKFSRLIIPGTLEDKPSFIIVNSKSGTFFLERNPLAIAGFFTRHFKNPRLMVLLGLSLGLIIAGSFWWLARRTREVTPTPPIQETSNPLHLKERRLHLLEDLEVSNHGAMAPLRSLRRLIWMLDAVQSGVGMNPTLVARMKEIWQDCNQDALPRLINILERARHAKISNTVVDEALAAINRINSCLVKLDQDNFSSDSVNRHLATLHKEEKSAEALLQSLRRQVSDLFRAPLCEVLEKVLRANHADLEENGVQVQTGMLSAMEAAGSDQDVTEESLHCRMDADELAFILDNLVGNACLAMASAPRCGLNIFWQPINGVVKIEVSDTGIGIATDDHQRVMEPGFSSRPGGGLGLSKSKRLLRKYDGHLTVKRSQPGQGTTFLLVVPRA